jgi:hypothetical protein
MTMVEFKPLGVTERNRLQAVLSKNAAGRCAIGMNPRDTTFVEEVPLDSVEEDNRVVSAIKSVPCHYEGRRGRDEG